ncbi:high nitrogen upregulated cytochrome P450 monooxygenase 2 [Gymnopilus junonius]|uniref:High nitrogen upregulated cytochrome P450 monooxygenase 2 n=1 Tax=Gymnopilus junonius TaxID=109634 RepID=A0A9P5TPF0_GYMJU|nr:high nitrogen upregulated cytochrome P450 monooxygenase 2 [Gymnopilus junonius]
MDYLLSRFDPMLSMEGLAALITHVWVQENEPESLTGFLLGLVAIASIPIILFPSSLGTHPVWQSYALFVTVILSSITVYRLSPLHPLARHPGPVLCRISKLWMAYISFRGKQHEYFKELHLRYGPIVRVGPNELSVTDKDSILIILGKDGLPKGPLWQGRIITPTSQKNKANSLISARDLQHHAKLRKPWNKAFGLAPMIDYTELVINKSFELNKLLLGMCRLSCDKTGHVDLSKWISLFSFGHDFGLMTEGDKNGIMKNMESALLPPSISQHIPWAALFAVEQAKLRATRDKKKDLFYHLLQNVDPESTADPFPLIVSNSVLAIIAGSDTTATTLSNIIYYLLLYPKYMEELRSEIEANFPIEEHAPIQGDKLPAMKMLNAIINEALRLLPPLPTLLQRAVPKGSGGKLIGHFFIPEGTAIVIPPYCLHRDPRYFSPRTEEFWPDRWSMDKSDDPNFVHDASAFIPFSHGPANCAGKTLAIFELRYLTAMLVRNFNISFQDGFAPSVWEENLLDRFVFTKGPLPVKLSPRAL